MKHVERAGGGEAIPDDMPPRVRLFALLLEHAGQRRDDGLPLPCPCGRCERHRAELRAL